MTAITDRPAAAWLPILIAGCLVLAVNLGARMTMGLFVQPMTLDVGLSREAFSLAIGIQNLLWGAAQPFAGAIAERYGTARTIAVSLLFYALGLVLMGFSDTPLLFGLSAGVLLGIAVSGSAFPVVFGAVARALPPEKRSWALGIATAGASFGQFVFSPFAQFMIDDFGWFMALMALAIVCALIVPLSLQLRGKADDGHGTDQSLRAALREALAHRGFLYLTVGFFVCGFHVAFVATHIQPFVVWCGLPAMLGASALATVGLFNIVGTYTAGVLGGRYRKKYLLSLIYLARAVVIAIFFLGPKTELTVLAFAAAFGLLWLSTVPLTTGLIIQIFGPRYVATLFGIVFFSHQVGAFFGAWLGGLNYDLQGNYDGVWLLSIALGLLAALIHWPIGDRPLPRLAGAAA